MQAITKQRKLEQKTYNLMCFCYLVTSLVTVVVPNNIVFIKETTNIFHYWSYLHVDKKEKPRGYSH